MNKRFESSLALKTTAFGPSFDALPDVFVAIPAKDEEERIGKCLQAISDQQGVDPRRLGVVVLLNNTRDASLAAIAARAQSFPCPVYAVEVELPPQFANAGWARRLAMEFASRGSCEEAWLLGADADGAAKPDWIAQILREAAAGVDAIAGYVTADWSELSKFPEEILALGALEWEYQGLAAELDAKADPLVHDPWPRHNQNCGANFAIRKTLYRQIGGLPPLPVGEDRALFDAVRAVDGKVRHSLAAHVEVSARTVGRASGGMADALRTRGAGAYFCDEILEPALLAFRRARKRSRARVAHARGSGQGPFGAAWAKAEARDPSLTPLRLRSSDLPGELKKIGRLTAALDASEADLLGGEAWQLRNKSA